MVHDKVTWMVSAVLPTPPSPNTTSLYNVIFPPDIVPVLDVQVSEREFLGRSLYF